MPTISWSTFLFQPTLPHRERPPVASSTARPFLISTHAPAQGATDWKGINGWTSPTISTHAPAQGATNPAMQHGIRLWISTHAPAQGATADTWQESRKKRNFNPRSRTGSDRVNGAARHFPLISTHAPAQGATWGGEGGRARSGISTHAPAQGATWIVSYRLPRKPFQPTLPHRERQQKDTKSTLSFCAIQQRIFWITFLKIY